MHSDTIKNSYLYIPVKRIHVVCAYCELNVVITIVPEDEFIAIPLAAKFG